MAREYTKHVLGLLDEGRMDADQLVYDLLNWLSESDVKEFVKHFGLDEEDEDEDYEDDGQPTEAEEWRDYDPDC